MKKTKKVKVQANLVSAFDLFDLTEKEWEKIAREAANAAYEEGTMVAVAKRLGVMGGGPLAAKAFLYGRIVESNERKEKAKQACMGCGEEMEDGESGDDITPAEMVKLLDLMKKVVKSKAKKQDAVFDFGEMMRSARKRKRSDDDEDGGGGDDTSYIG